MLMFGKNEVSEAQHSEPYLSQDNYVRVPFVANKGTVHQLVFYPFTTYHFGNGGSGDIFYSTPHSGVSRMERINPIDTHGL